MAFFKRNERKKEELQNSVKPKAISAPEANVSESRRSVVGQSVFIKGNFYAEEELLVEGKIEGKLNSKGLVVIGKNGVINAEVEAREVVIIGTVNGNVRGSYKVEVVPDGVLNGNIISQRVVLAEGAVFKGNIDMTSRDEKV